MAGEQRYRAAVANYWRAITDDVRVADATGGFMAGLALAALHPEYAIALHRGLEREWAQEHAPDDPYSINRVADDMPNVMGQLRETVDAS